MFVGSFRYVYFNIRHRECVFCVRNIGERQCDIYGNYGATAVVSGRFPDAANYSRWLSEFILWAFLSPRRQTWRIAFAVRKVLMAHVHLVGFDAEGPSIVQNMAPPSFVRGT